VDVTEPSVVAVRALCELREQVKDLIALQITAFPQDGIYTKPENEALLSQALDMDVDVVGAIPHYELTREDGVKSLHHIFDLAEHYDCLIDVHCDEVDDDQSRFLELLVAESIKRDYGPRASASHPRRSDMTTTPTQGAVLFAKSLDALYAFYANVVGFDIVDREDDHATLELGDFRLVIVQAPKAIRDTIEITDPPTPRSNTPIKLVFTASIDQVRKLAGQFGGAMNAPETEWKLGDVRVCDGHDAEGNIFQIKHSGQQTARYS